MTQPTPQPRSGASASRDIVIGATVYGHDNARFGSVAGSYRNYLIVERGFFMPVDYYVPMAAIKRADRDLVVLAVSRDDALTQGWERPPFTSETGQRGLRRPAVGRPATTPAAPGASVAAGRQRAVGIGTNPTGWPAPTGAARPDAASATGATTTRQPDGDGSAAAPRETTAVSPTAAFADTYAVGTNTDSYHAMTDFAPTEPTPAEIAPRTPPSPEPVFAEQAEGAPETGKSVSPADGSDATASGPFTPPERPTS